MIIYQKPAARKPMTAAERTAARYYLGDKKITAKEYQKALITITK